MTKIKAMLALVLAALLLCTCAAAEEAHTQWVDLGTGSNEMTLVVVLPDLTTKGYHIRSEKTTLLEALLELELVTVTQGEASLSLLSVDGCALPADQPDAYWFLSAYDLTLDSLVPVTQPLDELPLSGQTYAIGMINSGDAE